MREVLPEFSERLSELGWARVDNGVRSFFERWGNRWCRRSLAEITTEDIETYLEGLFRRGHSQRDIEKEKLFLRSFFRWTVREGWLRTNPAERLVKRSPAPPKAEDALRPIQQYVLLEACRGRLRTLESGESDERFLRLHPQPIRVPAYLYPTVLIGLRTGLRLREILRLRWGHVQWTHQKIVIPASDSSTLRPIQTPLDGDVRRTLASLLVEFPNRPGGLDRILDGTQLPLWKGQPDEREVSHALRVVRKRAGLPPGDFDSIRLSFLANCARAGVPWEAAVRVCDWEGDGEIVHAVYQRWVPRSL
jgi:integrase